MEATNHALRLRIQKFFVHILRDLQPLNIVHELYQEEIFDLDDMEEVEVEKKIQKEASRETGENDSAVRKRERERAASVCDISTKMSSPSIYF